MEELNARISELEKQLAELKGKKEKKQQQLEPVECPVCHKQLKNKYTLKTHMKRHEEGNTKVECPICHKHYCSVYYLKSHMKQKHNDEQVEKDQQSDVKKTDFETEEASVIDSIINDKVDENN